MGMIWRFSEAGKYASGDDLAEDAEASELYQISSGKFMAIYYFITWIAMGVCLCVPILISIFNPK